MSQPPRGSQPPSRSVDPWQVISYLVAGVAMYGLVGWLLDRWLGTSFLLPVGIVLGAALGVLTIHLRFRSSDRD
jgi:ATP synthase protein I